MASDSDNGTYFTQGSHTYRLLGESGLVEDEVKIHLTKGTIIFLVIGTAAFIAYFIFLIITLVEQFARLF